jgi:hypothetical protein
VQPQQAPAAQAPAAQAPAAQAPTAQAPSAQAFAAHAPLPTPDSRDTLMMQIHATVQQMRAHLERDEKVLRKLMSLLVEKGVCTREELIAKIHEE